MHVGQAKEGMALGMQTLQKVDGPCDRHPRGGHLREKLGNVRRRQSGAVRGTHDGVWL
jgi:hypothetical protein